MQFNDHYQSLGLDPRADAATIKRAYRRQARRHHPDVNGNAVGSQAAMARLNEAYQVLSDAKLRAAYDAVRESQVPTYARTAAPTQAPASSPASDWQPGLDGIASVEDAPQQPSEPRTKPRRGAEARARLAVPLADAYTGAERDVTIQPPGLEPRLLRVQIPRGLQQGQVLRLVGQGKPGSGGGEAGDLLLEIEFLPDPDFSVQGLDVLGSLPLAPWEAALGTEVELRAPGGQLMNVQVPPDSPAGRQLRLAGLGLPGHPGQAAGDLLLSLQIVLPPSDDPQARALWEVMAKAVGEGFDPRKPDDATPRHDE